MAAPPRGPGILAGAVVWAGVGFNLPDPSSLRVVAGAAIVAAYAALTASELWSERRKSLHSRWPALAIPAMHGFVLMLPILVGDFLGVDGGALNVRSGWVAAFAIELVLYAVGTVFIIFMLVSERTVKAHKTAASIDPLTGLFNRRGFSELTGRMISREQAAGRPVTVLIFDIDHFKQVNDRFGHPAGDEILKLFANVLVHTLRITDIVGRIGGEEFAAMLPCPIDEAVVAADRVRTVFASAGVQVDDTPLATSVSDRRRRRTGRDRPQRAAGGRRHRALSRQARRAQSRRGRDRGAAGPRPGPVAYGTAGGGQAADGGAPVREAQRVNGSGDASWLANAPFTIPPSIESCSRLAATPGNRRSPRLKKSPSPCATTLPACSRPRTSTRRR